MYALYTVIVWNVSCMGLNGINLKNIPQGQKKSIWKNPIQLEYISHKFFRSQIESKDSLYNYYMILISGLYWISGLDKRIL